MSHPSLDASLARLRQLQIRGGVRVSLEGTEDWYEVQLFPGAAEGEVLAAQTFPSRPLPADFAQFLRFTNGANLFLNGSGLHGVGVASTSLLVDLQRDEVEFYGAQVLEPYIVFARVNGAGDFLVFERATGRVLDGIHAEHPSEWRAVADSFSEWLETFLDANGRYYWIEALYQEDVRS